MVIFESFPQKYSIFEQKKYKYDHREHPKALEKLYSFQWGILIKGDKDPDPDEEDFVMPPEKERKKLVLLISCIGLTMTFMAAIMVGITLGLSHVIEEKVIRKSFFKSFFAQFHRVTYLYISSLLIRPKYDIHAYKTRL